MSTNTDTKALPWYRPAVGDHLKPPTRKLFETYCHLAPEEVEPHVLAIRNRAWSVQKYPCIGQFIFLLTRVPSLPWYPAMLARIKAGASLLDVGCGFAQDLRFLAADGAPTENMFASDIVPELWEIGYDLYRDAGHFKGHYMTADILDSDSKHKELRGQMDIILPNQLFHLFDLERQMQAGINMVQLSKPGTWILGWHIGSKFGQALPVETQTGGQLGSAGGKTKFYHTPETWQEMWSRISKETGTEWQVESKMSPLDEWGYEREDTEWMGPGAEGIEFICRRL